MLGLRVVSTLESPTFISIPTILDRIVLLLSIFSSIWSVATFNYVVSWDGKNNIFPCIASYLKSLVGGANVDVSPAESDIVIGFILFFAFR